MQKYAVAFLAAISPLYAAQAWAAGLPTIRSVTFTGSAGAFGATIKGGHFGAAPAGVPCTACNIPELSLVAQSHLTSSLSYSITAWSPTGITLAGINGAASDAIFAVVKNDSLKNVATWGGNFPGTVNNPVIKSISFSGSGATLQITINGNGFGKAPAGVPGTTDIPYLNFLDWNVTAPGSVNFPFGAGWQAQGITDTVKLDYLSWTPTKIVIGGFGGAYGGSGDVVTKGDPFLVLLWQTPGVVAGSTGPQTTKGGRLP